MSNSLYYTISAGQQAAVLTERGITPANCKFPILYLHGHGGAALDVLGGRAPDSTGWMRALAASGYAVVGLDVGGQQWGGPNAMAAIDAAYAALGRAKIGILGYSMGGLTSLNWLKRNPAKVVGTFLTEPVTNLDWVNTDPYAGGWTAEVTAAYGSFAASAGYRVHDEPASWRGVGPIRVLHTTDDEVVPYQHTVDFITAVNDPAVTLRKPDVLGGHTLNWNAIPAAEVVAFFDSL